MLERRITGSPKAAICLSFRRKTTTRMSVSRRSTTRSTSLRRVVDRNFAPLLIDVPQVTADEFDSTSLHA